MGPRWISLLLFFSGCKVSLRLIPFSAGAAFHSISLCAAFSYKVYIAALHCCVLYRAELGEEFRMILTNNRVTWRPSLSKEKGAKSWNFR